MLPQHSPLKETGWFVPQLCLHLIGLTQVFAHVIELLAR